MNDDTMCDDARPSLGAYALGTLEPADQQSVERHLAECPTCLTELEDLSTVVPVLATLSAQDFPAPAPSSDLFARIASAVDAAAVDLSTVDSSGTAPDAAPPTGGSAPTPIGSARKRSTATSRRPVAEKFGGRHRLLAVAAGIVVLAGGGAAIGVAVSSSTSQPGPSVATATADGVHLRVTATDVSAGTRLELTVKGLPRNEHCHLVATAADGSTHEAGRWTAGYAGTATVIESTDVARSDLRRLTLYGDDGTRLVTAEL